MPGGNRMGPQGMGPMTGRGAGLCAGYPVPGYINAGMGRGFGRGRGGGWGRRNWFYATGLTGWQRAAYGYPVYGGGMSYTMPSSPYVPGFSKDDELNALKDQAEYLENSLEDIQRRISELSEKVGQD